MTDRGSFKVQSDELRTHAALWKDRSKDAGDAKTLISPGEEATFRVELPVALKLRIDLQMDVHRFDADLIVPVELTARPAHPCVVFIEATPPRADQVVLELTAGGLRAGILQRVAGVDTVCNVAVFKWPPSGHGCCLRRPAAPRRNGR